MFSFCSVDIGLVIWTCLFAALWSGSWRTIERVSGMASDGMLALWWMPDIVNAPTIPVDLSTRGCPRQIFWVWTVTISVTFLQRCDIVIIVLTCACEPLDSGSSVLFLCSLFVLEQ